MMKSNCGKGYSFPEYKQIFPPEAMNGNNWHNYAVYCGILTASGIMNIEELIKVADWIHHRSPEINQQVAETCKKIVQEHLGYIWLQ